MGFADNYFKRYKSYYNNTIQEPPSGLLKFIVVIPVYREDKLLNTLESLKRALLPKQVYGEVLLVFNHPETDTEIHKEENRRQYCEAKNWIEQCSSSQLTFHAIWVENLPRKHAGPGLARKIGMDMALERFSAINNPNGFILSLDADTLVDVNYFNALEQQSLSNTKAGGCIYYFEHPIDGNEFKPEVYKAIILYELHLRYYKHALAWAGFPFSNYTIGSCFGVKALVYAKHGGMNKQQAGEDFYFLNKLFPHESFFEITDSCVRPSPRPSDRVVFGTGPVVKELVDADNPEYQTYNPAAFEDLRVLFQAVPKLYGNANPLEHIKQCSLVLIEFLQQHKLEQKLAEIQRNTSTQQAFVKRFFLWFDGFKVVKFLNFAHEHHLKKVLVQDACRWLLREYKRDIVDNTSKGMLMALREIDISTQRTK